MFNTNIYEKIEFGEDKTKLKKEIEDFSKNIIRYISLYKQNPISKETKNIKKKLLDESQEIIKKLDEMELLIENQDAYENLSKKKAALHSQIDKLHFDKMDELIEIKDNLLGNLEDSKLKYNSVYLYYLLNVIVVITIICLIVHFYFSKGDSVFVNAVLLIGSIILVYVIAKFVYDYFINK